MHVPAPEMTADQVLQTFRRDVPNLLVGAMIMAVGLVAAALSGIRRKHDPILIYLALLAGLYGLRMWMHSGMFLMMQNWSFYARVSSAIDYVVPIPALLFLDAAGLLHRRTRNALFGVGIVLALLALATLAVGPQAIFSQINAVLIIGALTMLVLISISRRPVNRDAIVIRRGLLIFAAFIFWENFRTLLGISMPNIEPVGFVVFLLALGYVAARQTLERDQQLGEIQKELEVARRIQLSILPAGFPSSVNFRVAARYVPMTSVAGDFYDFIVSDETQAGLLIADVSGHGVPAALIASMVKVAATSQRANAADPARLLSGMNAVLCGNTQNQFVTAAYVHLDSKIEQASIFGGRASSPASATPRESARNHREWFDSGRLRLCNVCERDALARIGRPASTLHGRPYRSCQRQRRFIRTRCPVQSAPADGSTFAVRCFG